MSESHESAGELARVARMLRAMARMARDASVTGTLEKGARTSAQQYNRVLQYLEERSAVPPGLFPPLAEDASFDEVGVAAAQLYGFLEPDSDEPRRHRGPGGHGAGNQIHIGFGGLKDIRELKELGQIIRENLPDWVRGAAVVCPKECGPEPREREEERSSTVTQVECRLSEVGARIQAAAEHLRRPDLSDAERERLAEQLSELAQEQARLARRHAELR